VRLLSHLVLRQQRHVPPTGAAAASAEAQEAAAQSEGALGLSDDAAAAGAARGRPRRRVERSPPPWASFCHRVADDKEPNHAAAAMWACAAAYAAWQLPEQLASVGHCHLGQLAQALCAPVRSWLGDDGSAIAPTAGAVPGRDGGNSAQLQRIGWCLLALEGIARMAWSVPRHERCGDSKRAARNITWSCFTHATTLRVPGRCSACLCRCLSGGVHAV
jgi:hypothetical protein